MRWTGHAAHMGKMRNGYSTVVGKPRCRWEVDIRLDLRETSLIHLSQTWASVGLL
jgi:hypothetical protein